MTLEVRIRAAAQRDVEDASTWYEQRQLGLGTRFLGELAATYSRIAETPLLYRKLHRETRRVFLRSFPFAVYFRVVGDTAVVVAIMHASRDPLSWKSRT